MITRRDALFALPSLSAVSLAPARVSPAPPKRVVVLRFGEDPGRDPNAPSEFWDAVGKKGWIRGKNLLIERAYANRDRQRLAKLAQEYAGKRVDLILVDDSSAAVAAARATRAIPILFFDLFFPVEQGLVDSLARPGRNVTGLSLFSELDMSHKRLEFLRAIVPTAKRLAWLSFGGETLSAETMNGGRFDAVPMREAAAKAVGFEPRFFALHAAGELDAVFREIIAWGTQAITVGGELFEPRHAVTELALRHRLPGAFAFREHVELGGLLSFAPVFTAYERRAAEYVDMVLRGVRPADLPIEGVDKYELLINMRTARTLGLNVPTAILTRADELIQ